MSDLNRKGEGSSDELTLEKIQRAAEIMDANVRPMPIYLFGFPEVLAASVDVELDVFCEIYGIKDRDCQYMMTFNANGVVTCEKDDGLK